MRRRIPRTVPVSRARALILVLSIAVSGPAAGCLEFVRGEPDPWPAPDFSVVDTNGGTHNLTQYRGQVLVVDLMATWCAPCKAQMPHLATIRESYPEDEVAILSIGTDPSESDADLERFAARYHGDWPFARDTDDVARKLELRIIPKLLVIDPDGNVVFETQRETYPAALARVINKHLED